MSKKLDAKAFFAYSYEVMKANLSQQTIHKTVSAMMVFWLSGLVFLFCCEMPKAQASGETDGCPLAKANHCAKQAGDDGISQFASFQTDNRMRDCCRILPNIFDKARKIESNPQMSEAAPIPRISSPKISILKKSNFAAPEFYRPIVLDYGGAYLKNQVFRI